MPQRIRDLLLANLKITPADLYEVDGPLGLADLMALTLIDRPDLKDPPLVPALPAIVRHARSRPTTFANLRATIIISASSVNPILTLRHKTLRLGPAALRRESSANHPAEGA